MKLPSVPPPAVRYDAVGGLVLGNGDMLKAVRDLRRKGQGQLATASQLRQYLTTSGSTLKGGFGGGSSRTRPGSSSKRGSCQHAASKMGNEPDRSNLKEGSAMNLARVASKAAEARDAGGGTLDPKGEAARSAT